MKTVNPWACAAFVGAILLVPGMAAAEDISGPIVRTLVLSENTRLIGHWSGRIRATAACEFTEEMTRPGLMDCDSSLLLLSALQAVRSATLLLHDLQAACPHQETVCRQDAVDQAPVSLALFYTIPACWWLSSIAIAPFEGISDE